MRLWLDASALSKLPDGVLLARYASRGDSSEAAFAALVARHGALVMRACRSILGNQCDAEDAFQATFLILVRRCRALWVGDSLGVWLHRVASRVALRARALAARRKQREADAATTRTEFHEARNSDDIGPILHAEIERLPARYRSAVVLCDLEGRTQEQAARQLGCPVGTIKSRLSRARERLKERLLRRGIAPAAAGLGALNADRSAFAIPPDLALATARFATIHAPDLGAVAPSVLSLVQSEVRAMMLHSFVARSLPILMFAAAATGAIVMAADRPIPRPAEIDVRAALAAPVPPVKPIKKELQPFQGFWKMELCDSAAEGFGAPQMEAEKWRWTVKDDEIVWGRQGEEWKLQLRVDPDKAPKEIDLTYLDGPHKGSKCLGMYEWGGIDGKSLLISIQDPGADVPRPKAIEMRGNGRTSLIFLRRIEPVDPKVELAAFQKPWSVDNVMTDAWPKPAGKGDERRWTIKGNEIAWTGLDGKEVRASFALDPNAVPPRVDLKFLTAPHEGETCPGVYEWKGKDRKELWLCLADPGSMTARPKDISFATNAGRTWIFLKSVVQPAK